LIVQVIDALAIDVGEPRVITSVPRRRLALTITDHEPEFSKLKEGPATDPVVLVEAEFLCEKYYRGFEITDGQYMLLF